MNAADLQLYLQLEARVDALTAGTAADIAALEIQLNALDAANSQDVTLGTANGLSLAANQVLSMALAASGVTGVVGTAAQHLGTGEKTVDSFVSLGDLVAGATLYVDQSSGWVGVGGVPSVPLHVVGANNLAGLLRLHNTATNGFSSLAAANAAGVTRLSWGHGNSASGGLYQDKSYAYFEDADFLLLRAVAGVPTLFATFGVSSGNATFVGALAASNLSGTNTGDQTLSSTTPAAVAAAGAVGVGTTLARADHVHAHGNQAGGALHADVVAAGASGFMTGAQATKLAGIATGATAEVDASGAASGRVNLSAQTLGAGRKTVDALTASGATGPLVLASGAPASGGLVRLRNTSSSGFCSVAWANDSDNTRLSIGYGNSGVAAPYTSKSYIFFTTDDLLFLRDVAGTATEMLRLTTAGVVALPSGGSITINSVAVPTISSADTFSNKAIGTGWSFTGTPTVSGAATLSGNLTLSGANSFTGTSNTFSNPIVHSNATGITAFAGGGQASAAALTKDVNFVTTVASANDSAKLPTAVAGLCIVVFNAGANACDVYPATGGAIDALGTNNPYSLAAGASREFFAQTTTQWRSR